jgi:hypothetical protein
MASIWQRTTRMRLRAALILAVAITAPAFLTVGSAQAALSGTGWSAATIPANFDLVNAAPLAPVSCVAGTKFCVVVAGNDAVSGENGLIGQGDLVTTDGGATWTGYTDLPSASMIITAISCPTVKVCWASGPGPADQPEVAKTANGGKTWTLATPADWASASYTWWPNSIDCLSASTCWLAGQTADSIQNPAVATTTNGGASWTTFSNLPAVTPDANGDTYALNGISCTSASSCLAVGGINGGSGPATVISTRNRGTTWSLSTGPALAKEQQLFSASCLPATSATTQAVCHAAGVALAAAGPATLTSHDGGTNWGGRQIFDNTGWLNSISCANANHCWAAGSGTAVALVGTSDGGKTWTSVTSDTTNEDGSVSCATVNFCVATTDGEVWVTTNDGGLATATADTTLG